MSAVSLPCRHRVRRFDRINQLRYQRAADAGGDRARPTGGVLTWASSCKLSRLPASTPSPRRSCCGTCERRSPLCWSSPTPSAKEKMVVSLVLFFFIRRGAVATRLGCVFFNNCDRNIDWKWLKFGKQWVCQLSCDSANIYPLFRDSAIVAAWEAGSKQRSPVA